MTPSAFINLQQTLPEMQLGSFASATAHQEHDPSLINQSTNPLIRGRTHIYSPQESSVCSSHSAARDAGIHSVKMNKILFIVERHSAHFKTIDLTDNVTAGSLLINLQKLGIAGERESGM